MKDTTPTKEIPCIVDANGDDAQPGLVLIFSAGMPTLVPLALGSDSSLLIGRGNTSGIMIDDDCISRRHADVALVEGHRWRVRDLSSLNGTFLDGESVSDEQFSTDCRSLRVGESLFLFTNDLRKFDPPTVAKQGDILIGPTLRSVWDLIRSSACAGQTLHITGESGSGKEIAAHQFHDSSTRAKGPFVAVNCATVPQGLAERLLFGARKGAYSGAHADVDGYCQAADGGTLFLDEVAELELSVQAKLLRVLETREVIPLGATKPRSVDVMLLSATHWDLRDRVARGLFREDLFFRIGRPSVALPAIRDRPEEIPWLVQNEVSKVDEGLRVDAGFVEACLLRPWPGNIRELLTEVRHAALQAGAAKQSAVTVKHLARSAGQALGKLQVDDDAEGWSSAKPVRLRPAEIMEALRKEQGNVARVARALKVHRTQLRRWMKRYSIDASEFGTRSADPEGNE